MRQNSEWGLPLGRVNPQHFAIKWQFQQFLNSSKSLLNNPIKQNWKHSWTMGLESSIKPRLESSTKNYLHQIGLSFGSWDQRLSIRWSAGDVPFKKLPIPANSSTWTDFMKIWIGSLMLFSVPSSYRILVGMPCISLTAEWNNWQ